MVMPQLHPHEGARQLSPSLYILLLFGGSFPRFGWFFGGFASLFLYAVPKFGQGWISLPGLIPSLFLLIGLAFIGYGIYQGMKGIRILRIGTVAYGELVGVMDTGVRVNDEPVWQLTYRFTAPNGSRYAVYGNTETLSSDILTNAQHLLPAPGEKLDPQSEQAKQNFTNAFMKRKPHALTAEDAAPICPEGTTPVTGVIFYNPQNPMDAMPLSGLPGQLTLGPNNSIQAANAAWPSLIPPAIVLIAHALVQHYFFHRAIPFLP